MKFRFIFLSHQLTQRALGKFSPLKKSPKIDWGQFIPPLFWTFFGGFWARKATVRMAECWLFAFALNLEVSFQQTFFWKWASDQLVVLLIMVISHVVEGVVNIWNVLWKPTNHIDIAQLLNNFKSSNAWTISSTMLLIFAEEVGGRVESPLCWSALGHPVLLI